MNIISKIHSEAIGPFDNTIISAADVTVPPSPSITAPSANPVKSVRQDAAFWKAFGFDLVPLDPDRVNWDGDAATHFDRHPHHGIGCIMPEGVVAFAARQERDNAEVSDYVKGIPFPPMLNTQVGGCQHYFYRIETGSIMLAGVTPPVGVRLCTAGNLLPLPSHTEFDAAAYNAKTIAELSFIPASYQPTSQQAVPPPVINTPLEAFSLRGRAAEFEEKATEAMPLLGDVCLAGQATVWYAPPNAGKTLIALSLLGEAVSAARVAAGNVYYINADDSSSGFAHKMRLMDDLGVHTLSPGQQNFTVTDLAVQLAEIGRTDKAKGIVIIIDTLKKFVDLMHKRDASEFATACRSFVMHGGTVLALAHTNKNALASGKLNYAGTADILQDFDASYIITPLEGIGDGQETVVQFAANKVRGKGAMSVAYAYAAESEASYDERLASVRVVDPATFDDYERHISEQSDAALIAAIKVCIESRITKKMDLAKAAAARAHDSKRSAIKVLERYAGEDPELHHWTYNVRERGAKVFALLAMPEAATVPLAA